MNIRTLSLGAFALAVPAFAALTSGLSAGENVTPFHPTHVSGPLAGKKACFPCTFQNRPQVQVWVNGDSAANVEKLAMNLQTQMQENKGKEFKAMVVLLSSDEAKAKAMLQEIAAKTKAKDVAMAYLSPQDEAVKAYKINLSPEVKNTVVAYRNWKVEGSMVNLKADAAGLKKLDGAIAQLTK